MYKQVKNEQWTVDELKSKTGNKEISKPQFQRKKNGIYFQKMIIKQMKRHIFNFYMIPKIVFMQLRLDKILRLKI